MGAIRLAHSTVVVSLAAVLLMAASPRAQGAGQDPSGRWEFTTDTPAPAAAGARGRGGAAQAPATRTVTLNLKLGPGGTLGGTVATSGLGRGGGTGGNPPRPVEISDGKVDATHVSFSVWQFDGYKNRMRYDGVVEGDRLTLTMSRDTASGPERTQAVAVRETLLSAFEGDASMAPGVNAWDVRRRLGWTAVALLTLGVLAAPRAIQQRQSQGSTAEITPYTGFDGRVQTTTADSTPAPLQNPQPRQGSPNIIYIVLDDVGFADLGAYGSEIVTPNIDALAEAGLRYNNFHTHAICSTTRAALLTGRVAHAVGMKDLAGADGGYPNSRGRITPAAATIAQILRTNGYATYGIGKWHLTPGDDMSPSSPRTHWPLQKGFDRYYGFLSGWTDQFHPSLIEDNHSLTTPDHPGYHFSEDIVDHTIEYLREGQAAGNRRPFFLYFATGAAHAPIQAPPAYIEKYKGSYSKGWDAIRAERFARQKQMGLIPKDTVMPPRNPDDKAWGDLTPDERKVFARYMAVYAGFIEHTDAQIGRLIKYLKASNQFDNTVIFLISDNGAAPEAGPEGGFTSPYGGRLSIPDSLARLDDLGTERSQPLYQRPWAMAGVAPFKKYKLSMQLGGVRDPLIVTWPNGITAADNGAVRAQFIDVIDLTPTVLEVVGVQAPDVFQGVAQMPIHGRSILATMRDAKAANPRDTQVFELRGERAIYDHGWRAVSVHAPGTPYEQDVWELYDVTHDYAEANNLATRKPEKLKALQDLWWSEARKYGVLPLTAR